MKITKDNEGVKAYKIHAKDGRWSIILASDEYSASELFQDDNNVKESDVEKIEPLDLSEKIPNIYNGKTETIEKMAKDITFFPRCILEIDDLPEVIKQRYSGVK